MLATKYVKGRIIGSTFIKFITNDSINLIENFVKDII